MARGFALAIARGWFNLRLMAFSSLLDEPAIRERAVRFTVEQYHRLGEAGLMSKEVELLEGIIIKKVPKSSLHSAVTQRAVKRLRAVLGPEWDLRQEQPLSHEESEPEPAMAVISFKDDDYSSGHPTTAELVIEVSISSVELDQRKQAIYAGAGVREYWIILPEEQRVEVYTLPLRREYGMRRVYVAPETVISESLPGFQLDLATFFPS